MNPVTEIHESVDEFMTTIAFSTALVGHRELVIITTDQSQ